MAGNERPQNQAAWMHKGARHPLRVEHADMPVPGDDDIVIKNHAVAVNPADWKLQDNPFFIKTWPFVLGGDVAGEVHEVGKNVTKFRKGDRVCAHLINLWTQRPQDGGFQLYSNAPAKLASKIPDILTFAQASVLPLAFDTAVHGLYGSQEGFLGLPSPSLNPRPIGKTIVIWGGSSSVGVITTQLAVASGVGVVAVASERNHQLLQDLGAATAIDYNQPSVVEDVVKAVQAIGVTFAGIYDAISNEDSYKHVLPIAEKLGGSNIALVCPRPKGDVPANVKFGDVIAINEVGAPLWEHYVPAALEQGKLKALPETLVVGKGLKSIQKGLDTNKAGVSARKVVIAL